MLAIAGQTAGPNWLKFLREPMCPGVVTLRKTNKDFLKIYFFSKFEKKNFGVLNLYADNAGRFS